MTTVGNADPIPLGGVGLVVGLEGTGGEPANDNYRTMLEDELTKQNVKDVKRELANPNHALVVVTALYPPGAVKGDPIDVEVSLPPHAGKATSLRGGYLCECVLSNYDYTKHLDPNYKGSNAAARRPAVRQVRRPGARRAWATATRPTASSTAASGAAGTVCGRTRSCCSSTPSTSRPASPTWPPRTSTRPSAAGPPIRRMTPRPSPHNNLAVELHVPPAYKLNMPRFLRVVRLVPLQAAPDSAGGARTATPAAPTASAWPTTCSTRPGR